MKTQHISDEAIEKAAREDTTPRHTPESAFKDGALWVIWMNPMYKAAPEMFSELQKTAQWLSRYNAPEGSEAAKLLKSIDEVLEKATGQ